MLIFHEEIARRKLGQTPDWKVCVWERIGPDACKLEGGITTPIASGKRKGQPKWGKRSTFLSCVVTDAELKQERAAYEARTGNCSECQGSGQVIKSWSVAEGVKTRDCTPCGGTGRATVG